jgi:hypothetical protein
LLLKRIITFCVFSMCYLLISIAQADVLDPYHNINAPPGALAVVSYLNYEDLPKAVSKGGDETTINLRASALLIRPIYFFPEKLADKFSWGANAIFSFAHVSMDSEKNSSGLGDIMADPFIYFYENEKDNVYLSFWEFVQMPTGQYDKDRETSLGNDAWWFAHMFGLGWYPSKLGLDANFTYWQKGESNETNYDYPDAFETEAVLHYGITEKFRVGVQGAAWWDLQNAKEDGIDVPDTKGINFKTGFNLGYNLQENLILNLRHMIDVKSENWAKGTWTYLRFYYVF